MWLFGLLGLWTLLLELQVLALPDLRFGPLGGDYDHNVIEVAAGLLCIAGALRTKRERGPWLLVGVGVLAWALGNLYHTVVLYDLEDPPIPSLADAGFLVFPVLR